jgi:myo-inositol-1(or 4)-monophosphatase
VTADDVSVTTTRQHRLADAVVLASRSEVGRGEWRPLAEAFHVEPTGSIAWKLALVACGRADATISLAPKHGWDVAAGVLLVEEAGGRVARLDGSPLSLARPDDLIDGLIASNAPLFDDLVSLVDRVPTPATGRASMKVSEGRQA